MGSRGSVIPYFLKNKNNSINITDMNMTRFNITLDQGVKYVLRCLEIMWWGNIYTEDPFIKSET